MNQFLDQAAVNLEQIKGLLSRAELNFVDLGSALGLGVGIAIAWSESDFTVVSIAGAGSENQFMVTCGVLRDINRDRLPALDACNGLVQNRTMYPFYLHDADAGWDILVQHTLHFQLLFDVPSYVLATINNLPQVAASGREEIEANYALGGRTYRWGEEDCERLFTRSLI
jgi:hypothetical protein